MGRFFRSSAPCLLGVLLVSSLATPANAQLKSFAAIGTLALDPPLPGTEDAYQSLTVYLKDLSENQEVQILQSPANPELPADRAERFARCTLRTDLPKPRPFGLVCRDYAGQYLGTLRATTTFQFQKTLRSIRSDVIGPRARPLTQYEFISVDYGGTNEGGVNAARYVADLLRSDGPWQVVQWIPQLSSSGTDRILRCAVSHRAATAWWKYGNDPGYMSLKLYDTADHVVRVFFWYPGGNATKNLQKAVRVLLNAWRADEEIYKPLPPDGPRPPKAPSP